MILLHRVFAAFLFGLVLYGAFYTVFGDVLGRNDLTDKPFHLERSLHPWEGEYYAPLVHWMVFPLTLFLPVKLAASLAVPFLLFFLLPASFVFAWSMFDFLNVRTWHAEFYIFFVAYLIPFCALNCTWAQALNMAFVFLAMGFMFIVLNEPEFEDFNLVIFVLVALGFFSHTVGGLWLVGIYLVFLMLTKQWNTLWIAAAAFTMSAVAFPSLFSRVPSLILAAPNNMKPDFGELLRILLLWVNPLNLWLVWEGLAARLRTPAPVTSSSQAGWHLWLQVSNPDKLLLAAVGLSFSAILFDSEYRSLLSGLTLLGLYGVYGIQKHPRLRAFFVIWQVGWGALLLLGMMVSYNL